MATSTGNRIAAARTGSTASASSGVPSMPTPPPKPPFDMPVMMTAGIAIK